MQEDNIMPFESKQNESIIKVIGVGGGGGNAVNHMYEQKIHDVTFAICNTDRQVLNMSPIPMKIQLGSEGLGAGNRPEKARIATEESIDSVKNMLNDGSKMVFITAGMGGGTGTGAAPIIAKTAKEMGILTVGIVTIPFLFEGFPKINQALDGVEEMSKYVDALLVINNERLRDVYPDLSVDNAFGKANDTLSIAAKSIAETITLEGKINLDFNDVKTVLKDGGISLMSTGYGEGEGRITKAFSEALHSPLKSIQQLKEEIKAKEKEVAAQKKQKQLNTFEQLMQEAKQLMQKKNHKAALAKIEQAQQMNLPDKEEEIKALEEEIKKQKKENKWLSKIFGQFKDIIKNKEK